MNKSYSRIKADTFLSVSREIDSILKTNINRLIKIKINLNDIDSQLRIDLLRKLGSHFHTRFTYSFTSKEIRELQNYIINKKSGIYRHYNFFSVVSDESDLQAITYDDDTYLYKYKKTINSLENINYSNYHSFIKKLLTDDIILFQDNNFRKIKIYEKE